MLLFSRSVGQRVVLPRSRIVVTVCRVQGKKVVLGFQAPPDQPIHREEVYAAIRATDPGRLSVESGHRTRR